MPTVTFTPGTIWCKLLADKTAFALLDAEFSYFMEGYQRMPAYKSKQWDGKKHLLTKYNNFPSGLLEDAIGIVEAAGYKAVVNDGRVRPKHPLKRWNLKGADEREHQTEAYTAAIEAGRGIVYHATGAGKTEVMAGIIQMLDLPSLVLVNQTLIATQTQKRLSERLGIRVGLLTGTKKIDGRVVVATFQTLLSQMKNDKENQTQHLKKYLNKFQVMCIDEAHHTLAATYQRVANTCEAYYRFAFSATPFKSENFKDEADPASRLHIIGTTGPVIDTFTPGEGVAKKLLVPAHITMVKWHPDKPNDGWKGPDFEINDWDYTWVGKKTELVMKKGKEVRVPLPLDQQEPGLYTVGIAEHTVRNSFVVDSACALYDEGLTTLILVTSIDHGLFLQKAIQRQAGKKVLFLQGLNTQAERDAAKRLFEEGTHPILIATTIFDEGVDIPSIEGLVFAQGGKAQHRVIQRIGRGMRPKDGKLQLEVIDFWDTHSKVLWKHSKERMKAYRSDPVGYKVEIVEVT